MSRLITFGCSYTYGEGLPDVKLNLLRNPKAPSKLSWTKILSDELGLELVNVSFPGSSNTEILYNILTFNFQPDDIVVVMWTHCVRDIRFDSWLQFISQRTRLGFWTTNSNKAWESQITIKDYVYKTWLSIHHAGLFLKSKKINHLHYPFEVSEYKSHVIKELIVDDFSEEGFIVVDKVKDGHPGVESNKLTAYNILRILNEK